MHCISLQTTLGPNPQFSVKGHIYVAAQEAEKQKHLIYIYSCVLQKFHGWFKCLGTSLVS